MPMFGIFNARTDVDSYDGTQGLFKQLSAKESALKVDLQKKKQNKNFPHLGIKPVSVLSQAFRIDTVPSGQPRPEP